MLRHLAAVLANPHKAALGQAVWGSRRPLRAPGEQPRLEDHLEATYHWLCAAQDAYPDGGVAGLFDFLRGRWSPSYPETTGYIIPTFLALAEARADPQARARALRMADWEADVQMEDGAVLSGLVGGPPAPAVFNTGQAIFGWVAAFEETGSSRYAEAARSAADWLVRHQEADGAWRRNLSMMTTASAPTYNSRCAWALALTGLVLGEEAYVQAARANCDWILTQQNDAGWFAQAGFSDGEIPLLHTTSYVIEGLLGVHMFTGDARYLEAAKRGIDPIAAASRAGRLSGRFDASWRGTVRWRCVTGDAQVAVVLHRLEQRFPGNGYAEVARGLIEEIAQMQLRIVGAKALSDPPSPRSAPIVGGVPGSFPVWGEYIRFGFPNWAAKFYLDALLLELYGVDELSARTRFPRASSEPAG